MSRQEEFTRELKLKNCVQIAKALAAINKGAMVIRMAGITQPPVKFHVGQLMKLEPTWFKTTITAVYDKPKLLTKAIQKEIDNDN